MTADVIESASLDRQMPNREAPALKLQVASIEPGGRDTKLLCLEYPDGSLLPPATPGANISLCLPGGLGRQYSLLNPGPAPRDYLIAVRKDANSRGGSAFVHDRLASGDAIDVLAPRNDFPLIEDAKFTLLIGGGIGITPLLAMASRLSELHQPFRFHAAFASRAELLLTGSLDRLAVDLHFDDAAGQLFPLGVAIADAPRDAQLYCCGPAAMIEAFIIAARADGRDEAAIHVEYFTPPSAPMAEGSFSVALARSGIEFVVPPGTSILDMVRASGIAAASSCEQGTCGACEVKVLEGVPDHFDAVLSPKDKRAGKSMMICCSGALSDRIVLDL
ncbi:MAG: PDR/VanB family oxidoreductase [Sphingomonas sp.]